MRQFEIRWEPEDLLPNHIPIEVRREIARHPVAWQKRLLLKRALAGRTLPRGISAPIDYDARPACYWQPDNLRHVVVNIKGAERKKRALQLIETGRLDEATDLVLADSLSAAERAAAGKVHPALMGGEYLPDFEAGEVEIARITMASTTEDVISIRACPARSGIAYRVVDEYQSLARIKPEKSRRPLRLRQLVQLIDTASRGEVGPVGLGIIQTNLDCEESTKSEDFAEFLSFSSEFYPDLSHHYWFAVLRWVEHNSEERSQL
jgi:hypothetical protein